jgi:hypothetical protein
MILDNDPSVIEERNKSGQTFLLAASTFCCCKDCRERVSLVLSRGADAKPETIRGTPTFILPWGSLPQTHLTGREIPSVRQFHTLFDTYDSRRR